MRYNTVFQVNISSYDLTCSKIEKLLFLPPGISVATRFRLFTLIFLKDQYYTFQKIHISLSPIEGGTYLQYYLV